MQNGAIAVLLVVAVAVVLWRLALRGPSRMARALYVMAGLLLGLWLVGLLLTWLGSEPPG